MSEEEKIDVKIGTKKEAAWQNILDNSEKSIINSEIEKEISEMIVERAQKRIEEEKQNI